MLQSQILVLQRRWQHHHQPYALTVRCLNNFSSYSSSLNRDNENDNNHIDDNKIKAKARNNDSRPRADSRPRIGQPHPRNSFQGTYDMDNLIAFNFNLKQYVTIEPNTGRQTINWANPSAVRALNMAILFADYGCHPIVENILPGRADYVHYVADLLQKSRSLASSDNNDDDVGGTDNEPRGEDIVGFDIGTGASCIYPRSRPMQPEKL